jgi:hypothetical protein
VACLPNGKKAYAPLSLHGIADINTKPVPLASLKTGLL